MLPCMHSYSDRTRNVSHQVYSRPSSLGTHKIHVCARARDGVACTEGGHWILPCARASKVNEIVANVRLVAPKIEQTNYRSNHRHILRIIETAWHAFTDKCTQQQRTYMYICRVCVEFGRAYASRAHAGTHTHH